MRRYHFGRAKEPTEKCRQKVEEILAQNVTGSESDALEYHPRYVFVEHARVEQSLEHIPTARQGWLGNDVPACGPTAK